MAGKGAVLSLKITGDTSGGVRALDDVDEHTSKLGDNLGKLGALVGGAFAVDKIIGFGKAAFNAASDVEQSTGAIAAVFGEQVWDISDAADRASTAVGLSTSQYENMATVIGSQLKNAGLPIDQVTDKTQTLIQKGADMASVFGGSAADAVEALSSALKGEMDPIERYGVSLNQAAIQSQMAADHTDKLTGAAANQAKASAILELINKQTGETTGQWAAQSGTAAEAQQILSSKVTDLEAKIGSRLLPAFSAMASWASDKLIPALSGLTDQGTPLGDMLDHVGSFVTDKVVPAVSDLYNWLAPKLIPIFQDVAHIIGDVAVPAFKVIWSYVSDYVTPIFKSSLGPALEGVRDVFHVLAQKLEENKGKFQEIYDKVKPFLEFLKNDVAPFVGGALKLGFEALGAVLGPIIDSIAWILDKAGAVVGFIGKVGSFLFGGGDSGPAAGGGAKRGAPLLGAARGAAPLLLGAGSGGVGTGPTGTAGSPPSGAGDTYTITINGVLNADDAADQIRRLLDRQGRMTGRTVVAAL